MQERRKTWKLNWKILLTGFIAAGALLLLFFACKGSGDGNSEQASPEFPKSFTVNANIHFGDMEAVATVNRIGDGICDVTLISPKALNGMKFEYDGSDIAISYLGMQVKLADDGVIASAMTSAIVKAVDTAARGSGITMKKKGSAVVMKGMNDTGEFELKLDKKTASLLSLKIPSLDLECTFGE